MAKIDEIIQRYYDEAHGGIVQKSPSALRRGEGTEKEYFIFKVDLVGSTVFISRRAPQTYLKIAHTFLSSIDEITRYFGSDANQVEYAGDSVIAYFPKSVGAIDVLKAAYCCREAARKMKQLDRTLNQYSFKTKTVVHFGKLIVAKIGPRGDSTVSAIGPALHKACKMEIDVPADEGRASKEFREQLEGRNRLLLTGNFKGTKVARPPETYLFHETMNPPLSPRTLLGMRATALGDIASPAIPFRNFLTQSPISQPLPQVDVNRELIDYSINWDILEKLIAQGRL